MSKIVVYTACFGNRERPQKFTPPPGNAEYVVFTDQKEAPSPWRKRSNVFAVKNNPRRLARLHKAGSHILFPDAEVTIWIDCHGFPLESPEKLVEKYLAKRPMATFKHCCRTTVVQEAKVVIDLKLDDKRIVNEALVRFAKSGCPDDLRLAETPVVMRRHTTEVIHFNQLWLTELQNHSIRDQISFPYCAWMAGIWWQKLDGWRRGTKEFKLKR